MPARLHSRETVIAHMAEVFRDYGFEGASLEHISKATGLGKGSLYHAFPNGKADMADAVLKAINGWFAEHVFAPLEDLDRSPIEAVEVMLGACDHYFHGGGRVCLVATFALTNTRDIFHAAVNAYFVRWLTALQQTLERAGLEQTRAQGLAEDILAGVQGGLVIARAVHDPGAFTRALARIKSRVRSQLI